MKISKINWNKTKYDSLDDTTYQKLVEKAIKEYDGNWEDLDQTTKWELIEQTELDEAD